MTSKMFLHELPDVIEVFERLQKRLDIEPQLIEKDYWIMHCLWGLKEQGFTFELKGGTSLSKGYGIINRFSEDIDIRIEPPEHLDVKTGKNHDKKNHIASRFKYFDWLTENINIPGITPSRDESFDDKKGGNGGIRLNYKSYFKPTLGVKDYILLEVGFDKTTPNKPITISSWAYDEAAVVDENIKDNQASNVPCYLPGYTFVEKLSAISGKYKQEQEGKIMPVNFIRHYYDVYQLLADASVQNFIDSKEYFQHKESRFRKSDELDLRRNEAFLLKDQETRQRYTEEYKRTKTLYYTEFPSFDSILERIEANIHRL